MTRQGIFASVVVVVPVLLYSVLDLHSFASRGASDKVRLRTDLERDLGRVRPCEGRWTGLDYSPLNKGGPKELSRIPNFRRTASEILHRVEITPEAIRDRALSAIVSGKVDDAVRTLEAGIESYPRDAALYSNLAMAHLIKAGIKNEPYQLTFALSASHRAVVLDGNLPEAAFNHALILEKLHLHAQSRRAWRRYLDLDRGSEWAREARVHLSSLEKPLEEPIGTATKALQAGRLQQAREVIGCSTQRIRFHVENEVLPRWAGAIEESDLQSAENFLGLAEFSPPCSWGDPVTIYWPDTVGFIRRASGEAVSGLAAGHRLYGEGTELFN